MDLIVALRPKPRQVAALVMAAIAVAACVFSAPSNTGPMFSHQLHATVIKLDCALCHNGAASADRAGMPPAELCLVCHGHEAPDVGRPAPEVPALFEQPPRLRVHQVASLPDDVIFSHRVHVQEYGLGCADCHGDVGSSAVIPPDSAVPKDECMGCHAERGKRNDCAACHRLIDRSWRPPSHDNAWEMRHGDVMRSGDTASANRCEMCHTETTSCRTCHEQQAPRDHTHYWRLRGHGIAVSIDRERCETCHRTDFCTTCHAETRPISHRAGYGSPQNRHCANCHFPARQAGCETCHKEPSSHLLATPLPSWHLPSMNCRACHGQGVPLPHFDSGDTCTLCHR
jgi:hypothetical protein